MWIRILLNLKHFRSILYVITLPKYTLSWYYAEIYPILLPYWTLPFLNTLPNHTLTYYMTELNPISIHCRSVFSHSIKSQQYPQVLELTADVIITPLLNIYTPGPWKKVQKTFLEKVSQCRKWVSHPTPYPYTLQNPIAYNNIIPITIPYLNTLPNALGFGPKTSRRPVRMEHEEPLNFVSQSNWALCNPKTS